MRKEDRLQQYISDVDKLLGKIYLIGLNDICEDIIIRCFYAGESVEECVRWIGLKYNLCTVE